MRPELKVSKLRLIGGQPDILTMPKPLISEKNVPGWKTVKDTRLLEASATMDDLMVDIIENSKTLRLINNWNFESSDAMDQKASV